MKRILFILILAIISVCCLVKMNEQYDELARYPHVLSEEERTLVLDKLTMDEINYLVSQKIKPEQFIPYLNEENFVLKNTLWYDLALKTQKGETKDVLDFINQYRSKMEYGNLEAYLKNYSYNELMRFFDSETTLQLSVNPKDPYLVLGQQETLFTYEPSKLTLMTQLPMAKNAPVRKLYLRENVISHLVDLLKGAKESNKMTYGNLEVACAYLSYDQQLALLEENHDFTKMLKLSSGGQSELQLGYSVVLSFKEDKAKKDDKTDKDDKEKEKKEHAYQDVLSYLKDQCAKHGFVIRHIYDEKMIEIRYVSADVAMELQAQKMTLEEMDVNEIIKE